MLALDCRNSAPGYTYRPFYLACWANKCIPTTLKGKCGPVTIPNDCGACTATCYGFPTVETDITFTRINTCDWQTGVIVWVCDAFELPLTLFVNTYEKIYQDNPNQNPAGAVFSISGVASPTGSCSYNFTTGQTTGQISGVGLFEPQGCSCASDCQLPITVYFDESL